MHRITARPRDARLAGLVQTVDSLHSLRPLQRQISLLTGFLSTGSVDIRPVPRLTPSQNQSWWQQPSARRSPLRALLSLVLVAPSLQIRPYEADDWPAVWALLEPVFRAGETFPHDPQICEAEAQLLWVEQPQAVMVATDGAGLLVGTYYVKPNSLCLGAHVANAGYVVAEQTRCQGIGSRLCQHSLQTARRLGFRLMQFNLVVSTNTAGIHCWQRNGFQIIGTLPGAFRHKQLGYVDALVMVQSLLEEPLP